MQIKKPLIFQILLQVCGQGNQKFAICVRKEIFRVVSRDNYKLRHAVLLPQFEYQVQLSGIRGKLIPQVACRALAGFARWQLDVILLYQPTCDKPHDIRCESSSQAVVLAFCMYRSIYAYMKAKHSNRLCLTCTERCVSSSVADHLWFFIPPLGNKLVASFETILP